MDLYCFPLVLYAYNIWFHSPEMMYENTVEYQLSMNKHLDKYFLLYNYNMR